MGRVLQRGAGLRLATRRSRGALRRTACDLVCERLNGFRHGFLMENERESQYEEMISFVLDDTKGASQLKDTACFRLRSSMVQHTLRLPPRLRYQTMQGSTNPLSFLTLRSQPPPARRNPLDETRHGTYLPLAEAHQSGDSYTCVGTPGSSPYLEFVLDSSLSKAPTDGRRLAASSSNISSDGHPRG